MTTSENLSKASSEVCQKYDSNCDSAIEEAEKEIASLELRLSRLRVHSRHFS